MISNRHRYILACLSEECGEVVQVAMKMMRFGVNDVNPKTGDSNIDMLEDELVDLEAVIGMIRMELPVFNKASDGDIYRKQDKVDKWWKKYYD